MGARVGSEKPKPSIGRSFDTLEDEETFYMCYAKIACFSSRIEIKANDRHWN